MVFTLTGGEAVPISTFTVAVVKATGEFGAGGACWWTQTIFPPPPFSRDVRRDGAGMARPFALLLGVSLIPLQFTGHGLGLPYLAAGLGPPWRILLGPLPSRCPDQEADPAPPGQVCTFAFPFGMNFYPSSNLHSLAEPQQSWDPALSSTSTVPVLQSLPSWYPQPQPPSPLTFSRNTQ